MPRKPRLNDPIDADDGPIPVCAHGVASNDGSCMHAPIEAKPAAAPAPEGPTPDQRAQEEFELQTVPVSGSDEALFKPCTREGCEHKGRHVHMDEVKEPPASLLDEVRRAANPETHAHPPRPLFADPVIELGEVYFKDQTKIGPTNEYSILPGLKNCTPDHRATKLSLDLRARILVVIGVARGGRHYIQYVPMEQIKSAVPLGFSMEAAK